MKLTKSNDIVLTLVLLTGLSTLPFCRCANAQSYTIDWSTIDGGGGTSTGGVYEVSGTIGQPDADTMSGGNYTLQGGFWGMMAVQTPAGPPLSVRCTTTNTVLVFWPKPAEGWNLEYATELGAGASVWTQILPPYQTNATDLFYVEPPPATNRFYRLHKP